MPHVAFLTPDCDYVVG